MPSTACTQWFAPKGWVPRWSFVQTIRRGLTLPPSGAGRKTGGSGGGSWGSYFFFIPGRYAFSGGGSRYSIFSAVMMPYLGLAAAPPVALVKVIA